MDLEKLLINLGHIIRMRRKNLGLSQEMFAEHVGIHRTYIGAIERGERNISIQNLQKIALALNLKLYEMIEEAERDAL